MLPFSRVLVIAGVVTGVIVSVFATRSDSDISMAQLTPVEREQLRDQLRLREHDWPQPLIRFESDAAEAAEAAESTAPGLYGSRSGLSPQERQALREQVRGIKPEDMLDASGLSESVAVNESYPDGVSEPIGSQGDRGSTRR